jgi:hypothetical protein
MNSTARFANARFFALMYGFDIARARSLLDVRWRPTGGFSKCRLRCEALPRVDRSGQSMSYRSWTGLELRTDGIQRIGHIRGGIRQVRRARTTCCGDLVPLRLGWIGRDPIANPNHVRDDFGSAVRELLRNRDQIGRRIHRRRANVGQIVGNQHDRDLLRRICHGVVFCVLQSPSVPWRRHAASIGRLCRKRVRDGRLVSREQGDSHGRCLVIGVHARIGSPNGYARLGEREHRAIRVRHARSLGQKTFLHGARARYGMITDSHAHVRRRGIAHEGIDSVAYGILPGDTGGNGRGQRTRTIREEIQIGDATLRARPILADAVAGLVASAAMVRIHENIHALAAARALSSRAHAAAILTGCSNSAGNVASAAMARVGHGIDTLPEAGGLSNRTPAQTICTRSTDRAGNVASTAMGGTGHGIDALPAT